MFKEEAEFRRIGVMCLFDRLLDRRMGWKLRSSLDLTGGLRGDAADWADSPPIDTPLDRSVFADQLFDYRSNHSLCLGFREVA